MRTESEIWAAGGYSAGILAVVKSAGGAELVFSGSRGVERLQPGAVLWIAEPIGKGFAAWTARREGETWLLRHPRGYERDASMLGVEFMFRKPGEVANSPRSAPGRAAVASSSAAAPGAFVDVRA